MAREADHGRQGLPFGLYQAFFLASQLWPAAGPVLKTLAMPMAPSSTYKKMALHFK